MPDAGLRGDPGSSGGGGVAAEAAEHLVGVVGDDDVDPEVATLPGAHLVDLEGLGADLAASAVADDLRSVRAIVREEVAAHAASLRAADVAPVTGRNSRSWKSKLKSTEGDVGASLT